MEKIIKHLLCTAVVFASFKNPWYNLGTVPSITLECLGVFDKFDLTIVIDKFRDISTHHVQISKLLDDSCSP